MFLCPLFYHGWREYVNAYSRARGSNCGRSRLWYDMFMTGIKILLICYDGYDKRPYVYAGICSGCSLRTTRLIRTGTGPYFLTTSLNASSSLS